LLPIAPTSAVPKFLGLVSSVIGTAALYRIENLIDSSVNNSLQIAGLYMAA
jgi:hypothetical protein